MNKVYYSQVDSRWASHPYPAAGVAYANKTVKSSGCGPTCAAMVVSACKEVVYPDRMCDIARENGYRLPGGTANSFFSFVAKKWGIEMKTVNSSFDALQAVKDGYQVIILCGAGLWTTGGHFILAVGADGDNIEIYDSYRWASKFNGKSYVTVKGNSVWVEINDFKKYSNAHYFFAFKVDGSVAPTPPKPASTTKTGWVNTTKLPLNIRYSPNGAVVGSLSKGTKVTVYETSNGWCRIGTNKWCSAEYITYTNPNSSSSGGSSKPASNTVGEKRTFKGNTTLYSNSNLSGTTYSYLPKTEVTILENVSANVDKIKVTKTGRVAYVSTSAYTSNSGGNSSVNRGTVGKYKVFKGNTTLYSNSNLSGTTYSYLPNTQVIILENVSATVDKIKATKTGRIAYVNINAYK